MSRLQRREVEPGVATVFPPEMRFGDEPAEVGIALWGLGQHRHVGPVEQGELGAGDGLQTQLRRRLRERHRPV